MGLQREMDAVIITWRLYLSPERWILWAFSKNYVWDYYKTLYRDSNWLHGGNSGLLRLVEYYFEK